jgi:hypothetical protein
MNNGIVKKIMLLAFSLGLGGCASTSTPLATSAVDKPILSAAEAHSMIRVSVRTLPPVSHETTVAAND